MRFRNSLAVEIAAAIVAVVFFVSVEPAKAGTITLTVKEVGGNVEIDFSGDWTFTGFGFDPANPTSATSIAQQVISVTSSTTIGQPFDSWAHSGSWTNFTDGVTTESSFAFFPGLTSTPLAGTFTGGTMNLVFTNPLVYLPAGVAGALSPQTASGKLTLLSTNYAALGLVADKTRTATFTGAGTNTMQIVTVPEPTNLAVAGVGVACAAACSEFRRRRRMK